MSGRRRAGPRSQRAGRARGAGGRRRWFWLAGALLALVGIGLIAAMPFRRKSGVGRAVDVEIAAGASDADVVARLEAAGVVDSPRLFSWMLRILGGAKAKPGLHFLADDLSPSEVLRRLRRSPSATRSKVTIPEGFHRFDIARRLRERRICEEAAFLQATLDPELLSELHLSGTAEGFLFPATYEIAIDSDARDVVRRMVAEARGRIERLAHAHPEGMPALQKSLGFGEREVVTLASIVEKEAAVDDERPLVASVFLNRLREPHATGGKLQADPTAMYGCLVMAKATGACLSWLALGGKPAAEIQHDPQNPWSTYTHAGLPPTPIANPGERSLAAVLAPANTRYFYFVARGGGRHTFSESLSEHEKATKEAP